MLSLATHYNHCSISSTYEIPQSLRRILHTVWQLCYKELYEDTEVDSISL